MPGGSPGDRKCSQPEARLLAFLHAHAPLNCSLQVHALTGTCTPCTSALPANAHYVASGLQKNSQSCAWACNPGYTEIGAQALSGPQCVATVGGTAGLVTLQTAPSAALMGGVAVTTNVVSRAAMAPNAGTSLMTTYAPAPTGTPPAPRFGVAAATDDGESSDSANTGALARRLLRAM